MNFIGVELHKKSITVCVMNENLKALARKSLYCEQPDQIVEFFRQFRPFKVVVEATASYPKWSAFFSQLRKRSGTKRAIVAVARKLVCVLYAMLKTSTPYKILPAAPTATGTRRKRLVRISTPEPTITTWRVTSTPERIVNQD